MALAICDLLGEKGPFYQNRVIGMDRSLALYVQNTVVKGRSQNMTHRPSYKPLNLPGSPTTSNQFFREMDNFSLLSVLSAYARIT